MAYKLITPDKELFDAINSGDLDDDLDRVLINYLFHEVWENNPERIKNLATTPSQINRLKRNINAKDKSLFNRTPLHRALSLGKFKIAEYFINELEADVYAKDDYGCTPFDIGCGSCIDIDCKTKLAELKLKLLS